MRLNPRPWQNSIGDVLRGRSIVGAERNIESSTDVFNDAAALLSTLTVLFHAVNKNFQQFFVLL